MSIRDEVRLLDEFRKRLRRQATPSSVPGSLPILFFGDAPAARMLTVGLNPSDQEYLDRHGIELDGELRRFHTVGSLEASERSQLTERQCEQAIQMMSSYFNPGQPVFHWFRPLERVIDAMGVSFIGRTAAHLDLVQESTRPVWSGLPSGDKEALLAADLPFLSWQLSAFPARVVACNGATVLRTVSRLTEAEKVRSGTLKRIQWTLARVKPGAGHAVAVVGWNIPLTRPTGLGAEGERELGNLLSAELDSAFGPEWRA
jgi:hypothetical protein